MIIFLLPFVLLLTFGYRLQAYSGKRGFMWFNKFTPLLDAYYAPYKRNTRYWTGLMLLVRICLYLCSIIPTTDDTTNLVTVIPFFAAIAVLSWLNGGIYRKLYVNIIEASFILNIVILSSATYHIRVALKNKPEEQVAITHASYVSIVIALVELVGIVIFHLYLCMTSISFLCN